MWILFHVLSPKRRTYKDVAEYINPAPPTGDRQAGPAYCVHDVPRKPNKLFNTLVKLSLRLIESCLCDHRAVTFDLYRIISFLKRVLYRWYDDGPARNAIRCSDNASVDDLVLAYFRFILISVFYAKSYIFSFRNVELNLFYGAS